MSREFKVGDAVRAYDMGKPYDSIVVETLDSAEQKMAFVHFRGWSRKYDSWYKCSDLAHKNDEEACEALHKRLGDPTVSAKISAKKSNKSADEEKSEENVDEESSPTAEAPTKKRLREQNQEQKMKMDELKRNRAILAQSDLVDEGEEDRQLLSKLALPYSVKRHLVDEWSLITAEPKRLVVLPREYTVERIFSEYLDFKAKKCDEHEFKEYKDVMDGLLVWFDRALPMTLLYRQERDQYERIKADMEQKELTPSKVYGGEHAARMFVRMASLLKGIYVKQESIDLFFGKIADFLKFFGKKDNVKRYLDLEGYLEVEEALEASSIGAKPIAIAAADAVTEGERMTVAEGD